jgi:hypothetical protein
MLTAAERNDTDALEDIYDSLHDEIRAKNKKLKLLVAWLLGRLFCM